MKTCTKCRQQYSLSEFYLDRRYTPSRTVARCKQCMLKESSLRHKANAETNPKRRRLNHLKSTFKIELSVYNEMLNASNGCCYICDQPETSVSPRNGKIKNLCIDHCHTTGRIRGLLCDRCNRALGFFKDKIENLTKAIKYLSKL